jgi:hypothetical protein
MVFCRILNILLKIKKGSTNAGVSINTGMTLISALVDPFFINHFLFNISDNRIKTLFIKKIRC